MWVTTRPGCESSSSPHPAAGVQSPWAGQETAGGWQALRTFTLCNSVSSVGLGCMELPRWRQPGAGRQGSCASSTPAAPCLTTSQPHSPGWRLTERLWIGRQAHAHALPRGISYPSSSIKSREAGLCSQGRADSPAIAGDFAPRLPTGLTSLLNTGLWAAAVPLFPGTLLSRQALLS